MFQGHSQTQGVVLRQIQYGDADRIIGFFTRDHGKISAFARGAMKSAKRFGGGLDIFSNLSVHLKKPRSVSKRLFVLEKIELVDSFYGLRKDLFKMALASYLCECLWLLLADEDPHPELYDWLIDRLSKLEAAENPSAEALILDFEMLGRLGYAPQFKASPKLTRSNVFFSFSSGQVTDSKEDERGDGRWLSKASLIALANGDSLLPTDQKQIRRALDEFVTYLVGRPPKSQKFRAEVLEGN